jgi:hypothetical protein
MPQDPLQSLWSQVPTTPLYHYTSPAGLIGIVETKRLWASSIQQLNDSTEFKHAASLVDHLLDRHLRHERGPWNDLYGEQREVVPMFANFPIFVGSLSEAEDKLSQWRAYCPTGGFSVGFAPEILKEQGKRQHFSLLKCEYDEGKQKAICEQLISEACSAVGEETDARERKRIVVGEFVVPFVRAAPALKNPSFQEEQEWRLVGGPFPKDHPSIRFRASRYAVIPYFEFALAQDGAILEIERVVVGPNPDTPQAKDSVSYLISARGARCKRIEGYSGTLRNW